MTEEEWLQSKDPVAIVRNRKVKGGPQPEELDKMITMAEKDLRENEAWVSTAEQKLKDAEDRLNSDFRKML